MNKLPTTSLQWYFTKEDLKDTPSIIDGKPFEEEQSDRIKGCQYILAVAAKLDLTQIAIATATTFFHRFFMRQSMVRYNFYDIAATCLLVATKVEECTRRIRDIIIICAQKAKKNESVKLEEDSSEFNKWKTVLLHAEVILMETLCFDLSIQHPHTCLLELETRLQVSPSSIRRAWMLLYESLGLPLCVLYRPNIIATAALLLATNLNSNDKMSENWYESLTDIDLVEVHQLAAEMLEHYTDNYLAKSSTPQANSPHPSSQRSKNPNY